MKLALTTFGGLRPRVPAHQLPEAGAQVALNCDLTTGVLWPIKGPTVEQAVAADTKTIYRYNGTWLTWPTEVPVVEMPIEDDTYDRILYVEGGVLKMRGTYLGATTTINVGIPAPSAPPDVAAQAKGTVAWNRTWGYFWEEPDGTQKDAGTLAEGVSILEVTPGKVYTTQGTAVPLPPRITASASSVFVLWFDGYDASGSWMGRLYPAHSGYAGNTNLVVQGINVTGVQTIGAYAELGLAYDPTNKAGYTKSVSYVYTLVDGWGAEGPPSEPSAAITVDPTQNVMVSAMDTAVPASTIVTKKRIYRLVTSATGTEYQLVNTEDTLAIGTGSYLDDKSDDECGPLLVSVDWDPPPTGLSGLVACPGAYFATIAGKSVRFSMPGQPHAWPEGYSQPFPQAPVMVGPVGGSLAVVTSERPYIVSGYDPSQVSVAEVPILQGCVAARSRAVLSGAIGYASPDGYVILAESGTPVIITDPWYRREQWQALLPATICAAVHDNMIHLWHGPDDAREELLFKVADEPGLAAVEVGAVAAFVDAAEDVLWVVEGGYLKSWGTGAALTATWRGRKNLSGTYVDFGCCRVMASAWPVKLRLLAADVRVTEVTLTSSAIRRLPLVRKSDDWAIEIETSGNVLVAAVAQEPSELR